MKPLVVIAGPTACGKTETAIALAEKVGAEIISADSMQIYKYMDIGTAKPSQEEMRGIKHYLIDELYPDEEYSAAVFQKMAKNALEEIYSKNKLPILVGGTGFYINALLKDNLFIQHEGDEGAREYFEEILNEKGEGYLRDLLKEVDYESFENIHPNNTKRVIRALEFHRQTGEKMSVHNRREKERSCAYDVNFVVLTAQRDILYDKINRRVEIMLRLGLADEVKNLLERGYRRELVSMQGLGYKEIISYLASECDYDTAVEAIKQGTRHFAKRQLTWFKHQAEGTWIDRGEMNTDTLAEKILTLIKR